MSDSADDQTTSQDSGESSRTIGWRDLHLWQIQPVRDVLVGLAVVGLFILGDATSIVTVPLLLAILIAYLFEPVIAWFEAGHARTNFENDTSALVAENGREEPLWVRAR